MPGHFPSIDSDSLQRLRELVCILHSSDHRTIPLPELVQMAEASKLQAGVTVDFQATRDLGQPMVVLRFADPQPADPRMAGLSERERQVAALVAEGLLNKQIARRLRISLGTVKDHVHHILEKSGLPNRAAIAVAVGRPGRT